MTVTYDASHRGWSQGSNQIVCLQDKYELMKEIGDGSFGSVSLARVRTAGAHVARRGTLVAIKTMKKTFESFQPCLELREIIFLRSLPAHVHLVPALDIFLDPFTKKLHIAMEYMDGNLYQLMKARDHKPFDGSSVKSILYQILGGLEHIHDHGFFHRDIKPENILVTVSHREDIGSAFKRYSQLVTPPSTPPSYSIKIADFGLARETQSKLPYTTYVSTRWYRAPEVLLRAGEYSAPVDIWAIGAMAVEIATLKPLFPGGNEVDQVWRVCEIMGSPGNWVNKLGQRVGGGEWKDGIKLAQKLGFSFPKMAPHTMESILPAPQWPQSLANFVTWCLVWDPKKRPTSSQSLCHEYFADAYDPLRPKSSRSGLLGRKQSDLGPTPNRYMDVDQAVTTKTSSWFRKSLVTRESAPAVPQVQPQPAVQQPVQTVNAPVQPTKPVALEASAPKVRPAVNKRNTWANGTNLNGAPMPILPSIRPVSPLSNTIHAQGNNGEMDVDKTPKKIGRQLSEASHGNHYSDVHRQEAERALNGNSDLASPSSSGQQKESFFSHLRKRARRLSGRHQLPLSPKQDEEAMPGCAPWASSSNRNSIVGDPMVGQQQSEQPDFTELDRALQNVRYSLDAAVNAPIPTPSPVPVKPAQRVASNPLLKRHHSLPGNQDQPGSGRSSPSLTSNFLSRRSTRRAAQKPILPADQYETPDEQEELLDEALTSAHNAAVKLDREQQRSSVIYPEYPQGQENHRTLRHATSDVGVPAPYPTPSPSAKRNSVVFGDGDVNTQSRPIDIQQPKVQQPTYNYPFPTPPYDENEHWAAAAAASIFATGENNNPGYNWR